MTKNPRLFFKNSVQSVSDLCDKNSRLRRRIISHSSICSGSNIRKASPSNPLLSAPGIETSHPIASCTRIREDMILVSMTCSCEWNGWNELDPMQLQACSKRQRTTIGSSHRGSCWKARDPFLDGIRSWTMRFSSMAFLTIMSHSALDVVERWTSRKE